VTDTRHIFSAAAFLSYLRQFDLAGDMMAVMSSGHRGDKVTLTSVLHEFQEPGCIKLDYLLQESTPETGGSLSVYLLTKQRVPIRLQIEEWKTMHDHQGWKRGGVYIPTGTYRVMFLATLGLPYRSDIFLDNIELGPGWHCREKNVKHTGNF